MGNFDNGVTTRYDIRKPGNGVYAFILHGKFSIDGQEMSDRDGLGIWNTESIEIMATSENAEILLMELPMQLN